jgi:uncharacterized protein YciI
MFFFEKKNQKTFATCGRSRTQAPAPDSAAQEQKFFGSFFQKRTPFFLFLVLFVPSIAHAAPKVAIAAFDYADTSGEVRDQRAAHAARLDRLGTDIADALAKSGRFAPASLACQTPPCSAHEMDQDSMVAAARAQHARFVVFGGVHKMSTLIQWGQVDVSGRHGRRLEPCCGVYWRHAGRRTEGMRQHERRRPHPGC